MRYLTLIKENLKLRMECKIFEKRLNIIKNKLNNIYKTNKSRRKEIHENGDLNCIEHNKIENINTFFKKFNYSNLKRYIKFANSLKKIIIRENIQFENKRILDLGCGPGIVIKLLLKNISFKEVYCLDSSEVAIHKCKEIFPKAITQVTNILDNDLKNLQGYDVIFCTEVIEHIVEYNKLLKKIKDLIDKKTIIVLTVPDGRLDQSMYHVNFFTKISLGAVINKIFINCDCKLYNFNDSAICAIIQNK